VPKGKKGDRLPEEGGLLRVRGNLSRTDPAELRMPANAAGLPTARCGGELEGKKKKTARKRKNGEIQKTLEVTGEREGWPPDTKQSVIPFLRSSRKVKDLPLSARLLPREKRSSTGDEEGPELRKEKIAEGHLGQKPFRFHNQGGRRKSGGKKKTS